MARAILPDGEDYNLTTTIKLEKIPTGWWFTFGGPYGLKEISVLSKEKWEGPIK